MNEYKIKVKVNNNDDTRLWRYDEADDFQGLCRFITSTWNNIDFIAQYEDDEDDLITIASAQDLKDAFDFTREQKKKSLKVYVQNTMSPQRGQKTEEKEEKQQEAAPTAAPKQFNSIREMVFDFLSNQQIISLLPEFFGVIISKLMEQDNDLKVDEITNIIYREINDYKFKMITSHALYLKYGVLVIPYISHQIGMQQSLYPHFKLETIKNWIIQLIGMLHQVLKETANNSAKFTFKDIVIDIEYPAMTDTGKVIHFGVECNLCGTYPIIGDRYKCSICQDWDCCTQCEPKHDDHPLIKFKKSSKNHKNASFKGLSEIIGRLSADDNKQNDDDNDVDIDIDIDDDMVVDCICGAKMQCIAAKIAYNRCNTVYCDVCSAQSFNDIIYHCPNGHDPVHHKNGYDLCRKCANKKVLDEKEKEKEMEHDEEEQEEVNNNNNNNDNDKEEEEAEKEQEDKFEFMSQLTQIKTIMALNNNESDELIKQMLIEHKGDISRVIPLLLQ